MKYQPRYERSKALLIGIDDYAHRPLETAVFGAEEMANILHEDHGFEWDDMILLRDSEATRDNIVNAVMEFGTGPAADHATGPDDRLLVYFAGHGITMTDAREGKTGLLLPYGVGRGQYSHALEMDYLLNLERYIPAKHILYLLDCCFSGIAISRSENESLGNRVYDDLMTRHARVVVTAGMENQEVADRGPDGHSPFTGLLLDRLARRSGGLMTGMRLGLYMQDNVPRRTQQRQTPDYGRHSGQGGDFVWWHEVTTLDLPADILQAMSDTDRLRRLGAVYLLRDLLGDPVLKLPAQAALETLADDDSRAVSDAAQAALQELEAPPVVVRPPQPAPTIVESVPEPAPEEDLLPSWMRDEGIPTPAPLIVEAIPEPAPVPVAPPRDPILDLLPPPFEWCEIPAGRVTIEGTAFEVQPLLMAKYQTTYEQFQVFLDADHGFYNDEWWAGLAADADHRKAPDSQFFTHAANLPRDRVSWYDAVAYCRWLSSRVGYEVRLPTEWEWQWAAVGDTGWAYPWGPEYIQGYANIDEVSSKVTGGAYLEKTTPVTEYPQGASPFGLLNMSGNVWEWCLNEYGNPGEVSITSSNNRVVRGGSWDDVDYGARASYRSNLNPFYRYYSRGFRVLAVVPPSLQVR